MPYGAGAATAGPVTHSYGVIGMQRKFVPCALRLQDLYPLLFFLPSVATLDIHVKVCICSKYEQVDGLGAVMWKGVN